MNRSNVKEKLISLEHGARDVARSDLGSVRIGYLRKRRTVGPDLIERRCHPRCICMQSSGRQDTLLRFEPLFVSSVDPVERLRPGVLAPASP